MMFRHFSVTNSTSSTIPLIIWEGFFISIDFFVDFYTIWLMWYRFIAIDLETTGLSPEKDTIIEVAAILFSFERLWENFSVHMRDKRTMLINPTISLSEEVSIITGITDEMLIGKPSWEEVKDRVESFIREGDIIVGHNVLFDISMLKTHGINLENFPVIDTFELSEILSQWSESLNLWFLTQAYWLRTTEWEHRALGDTHLSICLFERYINELRNMSEERRSILRLMEKKEQQNMTRILNEIIELPQGQIFWEEQLHKFEWEKETHTRMNIPDKTQGVPIEECFSLDGNRETEIDLLLSYTEKYEKVKILAPNKKVQAHLMYILKEHGRKTEEIIGIERFCSIEALEEFLKKESWERKESILIGKLLWWLQDTRTWLLEELKFYGTEHEMLPYFRSTPEESSYFYEQHTEAIKDSRCVIDEFSNFIQHPEDTNEQNLLIIKDIPLFEESFRRNASISIHPENIIQAMRSFPNIKNLLLSFSLVADIYENAANRPTWQESLPPGNFWETYFIPQESLWEKKGKWLVLFHELLWEYYHEWKQQRVTETRKQRVQAGNIDAAISTLLSFWLRKNHNCNLILQINDKESIFHFIPRSISRNIRERIMNENKEHIIHYGYKLTGSIIKNFLQHECAIFENPKNYIEGSEKKRILITPEKEDISPGSVVLCTSQKQIREYGKLLKQRYTNTPIYMQWLSGGKWKILSLFLKDPENAVIIGLIDTWRDEFEVWKNTKEIHIVKLPFDPPSDPYFLARTVGISDNFLGYSQPMMTININTLMGRIRSAWYRGKIFCHDERLEKANWWKEIAKELL